MKSDEKQVHIGVDVSKEKLDVYNPTDDQVTTVANDVTGFRTIRRMARKSKAVVCCEPTGGCELELVLFLQKAKVPVAVCDAYRVRHWALSEGLFSKNDRIDAKVISRFADSKNVPVLELRDLDQLELRRRWGLYKTLVDMHVELAQKASSEHDKDVRKILVKQSKGLQEAATKALAKCRELIAANERWSELLERFTSVDGIADKTAIGVLALLPEIGKMSDEKITKLVGLVPADDQSGKKCRQKRIFGGRKSVRNVLYMAAVAAVQWNHILKEYYAGLKARMPGAKASKWALVPVARKLLHLMNRIASRPDFVPQKKPTVKAA